MFESNDAYRMTVALSAHPLVLLRPEVSSRIWYLLTALTALFSALPTVLLTALLIDHQTNLLTSLLITCFIVLLLAFLTAPLTAL